MSTCVRCGKEINSIVNCSGSAVCHECCRRCFHYNNEISVLQCRETAFKNELERAEINIDKRGRAYMPEDAYIVIIPPNSSAKIMKIPINSKNKNLTDAEINNAIIRLLNSKNILKPKSIHCRINKDDFRLIISKDKKGRMLNENAMCIADEIIKGYAAIVISNFGRFFGMTKTAAQFIADKINEFNSEEIVEDVGA